MQQAVREKQMVKMNAAERETKGRVRSKTLTLTKREYEADRQRRMRRDTITMKGRCHKYGQDEDKHLITEFISLLFHLQRVSSS